MIAVSISSPTHSCHFLSWLPGLQSYIQTYPMKVCSALTVLLLLHLATPHTFNCVFDKLNRDLLAEAANNVPEVPVVQPGKYMNGRLLTSTSTSSYGSLRIELEYAQFTSSTITAGVNGASTTTQARLDFILNSLFVAQQFFQKRLQAGQLSFVTIPSYCVDFTPNNIGGTIANTELLIFAQYQTDKNLGYGATGKSCDWISGSLPDYTLQVGRPTVGRIIFNTYTLVDQEPSLTNRLFQSVTSTTIHEITHILGFDSTLYTYFLDPSTGNNYSSPTVTASLHSSRPSSLFLTTPYVRDWARTHYGCPTLPGMLLENEDGTGAGANSHWERTAIYDQLMTATSLGASKGVFGVTYALLKDTGWYLVDDTFSETTNYGYNKGCSFVLDACYSSTSFTEFCSSSLVSSNVSLCQTTFYGKSVCSSTTSSTMSDSCGIYVPYFNCVDPASTDVGYQSYTYEAYGTNSYCVKSTLGTVTIPSTLQSRCYPFVCGTSSITFTIGSYTITCQSTEEGVAKTLSSLTGTLTCPSFTDFCTVSRKTCPNWCSQKGYCTGGVCNCKSGFKNSDCSSSACPTSYYSAVSSGCVSSCPSGSYLNIYSNTCESCTLPCIQCSGTPTNCVGCASSSNLKYFYSGTCYSSCPSSTFASGFDCIACDQSATSNCLTCTGSATTCTSCQPGTYLMLGTCVTTCTGTYPVTDMVNKQCVSSCPSYLLSTSSTCVYCSGGTYYFQGSCASSCTSSATSTYYPDDTYHACLQCSSSCLTCDGPYPENCTSCKSTSGTPYLLLKMCWSICPKGYYADPTTGKCQTCPSSLNCQSCKYSTTTLSPYCTSCVYGTFYSSATSTCTTSCGTNQYKNTWNNSCNNCDAACTTCNGPSSSSCLSCPGVSNILTNITGGYCLVSCPTTGYVQVGTTCQACDNTCSTCNGVSASQCATCKSGYYLNGGYCRYICPSKTYPDQTSKTCLSCDSSCGYCFDGTAQGCTYCQGSKYLYNFTCTASCPNGLTPNQWNVCYQLLYSTSLLGLALLMSIF